MFPRECGREQAGHVSERESELKRDKNDGNDQKLRRLRPHTEFSTDEKWSERSLFTGTEMASEHRSNDTTIYDGRKKN